MADPSVAGRLLVASPSLLDPNFARTVVLMLEHDADGAVGIVLNRPTDADLLDHVPVWWDAAPLPKVVFVGGPVGEGGAVALGRGEGAADMDGWTPVLGLRVIDLSSEPPDDVSLDVRIFAGYAGWGGGQLEEELATGAWVVVDARPDDVFSSQPDQLWGRVLRRSGGRYAMMATFPADPSLN
jgi:putative transcriptional regulator